MDLNDIKHNIPQQVFKTLEKDITELRPAQEKAVNAGLLTNNNLLICTPTASGKTLIGELAFTKAILGDKESSNKAIYIVPLKALANEKFKEFKKRYNQLFSIAISIGDLDKTDTSLARSDLIVCTAEKLDSILRHHTPWIQQVSTLIIDEIHLLNDPSRGPTLEIIITMFKQLLPHVQIIGLSATIGNPHELAEWLNAEVVEDSWRPVHLEKGVLHQGKIDFA